MPFPTSLCTLVIFVWLRWTRGQRARGAVRHCWWVETPPGTCPVCVLLLIARWARQRARRAVWTEPRPPATALHHLSPAAGLPGLLRATSHGLPLDVAPFLGGSLTFSLPLVSSSLLEGDRYARTFNNATWDVLGLKCKIQFVRSMI